MTDSASDSKLAEPIDGGDDQVIVDSKPSTHAEKMLGLE